MKTDLVTRLRVAAKRQHPLTSKLLQEAASEIEHLRSEVDYLTGNDDEPERCMVCGTTVGLFERHDGSVACGDCATKEEQL